VPWRIVFDINQLQVTADQSISRQMAPRLDPGIGTPVTLSASAQA
jgi:hypothetical protein